ncbi:MAG: hypothetical protein WA129_11920 [Acidovorax sp.]
MTNVLMRVHHVPYPIAKGDEVRSCQELSHLQRRQKVLLGNFMDHPDGESPVLSLRRLGPNTRDARLAPKCTLPHGLAFLYTGGTLTPTDYFSQEVQCRLREVVLNNSMKASEAFLLVVAQYAIYPNLNFYILPDFIDFNSVKLTQGPAFHNKQLPFMYRREVHALRGQASMTPVPRLVKRSSSRSDASPRLAPATQNLPKALLPSIGEFRSAFHMAEGGRLRLGSTTFHSLSSAPQATCAMRTHGRHSTQRRWPHCWNVVCSHNFIGAEIGRHRQSSRSYLLHAVKVVTPMRIPSDIQCKVHDVMAGGDLVAVNVIIGATEIDNLMAAKGAASLGEEWCWLLQDPPKREAQGAPARHYVAEGLKWKSHISEVGILFVGLRPPVSA